jgi:hypothetical protein
MGELSKREVVMIVVGIVVALALTIWATNVAVNYFLRGNSDDPLAKLAASSWTRSSNTSEGKGRDRASNSRCG